MTYASAMSLYSARSRVSHDVNAITRALEARRARGRGHLDLTESNPTTVGLGWESDALWGALHDPRAVTYAPEPFGSVEARRAISDHLVRQGYPVPPEQVLLTASTSEAYGYLFKLLCDPGDSVLVPAPSYPLLDVLADLEGVRLIRYPLAYDGEWHVDLGALAQLREANTRAVVTVHPNNPTGSFLKQEELAQLAALGLPILSDEVFSDYAHPEGARRVPSALAAGSTTLVFRLGGLSKALALPQLKLAWTAIDGPEALVREALARLSHIADAYLSPGTPVQLALPRLLERAPEIQARILSRVQSNLRTLRTLCPRGAAAEALRVEGGWYAIVRLPGVLDEEAWVLTLLERDDVLVQPGFFYDMHRGTHVVLSLITPEDTFERGVRRLVARVASETRPT